MNLKLLLLFSFWSFALFPLFSQPGLVAEFNMDGCTLNDSQGTFSGITFFTNCECGVRSNGLNFANGANAEFDDNLNEVLRGDWSISFYVQINNTGSESVDILYLGEECSLDSVFSVRYLTSIQQFRFQMASSRNNEVQLNGLADRNSCWQHVVITKDATNFAMYINGILTDSEPSISLIDLNVDAPLTISNSPCQFVSVSSFAPFEGNIDELRIFNRPLTEREIGDSFLFPDKIITNDTTIFQGSTIRINTGGSCSSNFSWSPTTGLDDPSLLNPLATPDSDITYTLTVNGNNCQSVDQINIRVADPSQLTCEDLKLPSAFTPNDDRINDTYGISNRFLITDLQSFEVFNRWGGRVFYTNDINGEWDGSYQDAPAPANSYVYKVAYTCNGQMFNKTGTVNLLK